MKVTIARWKIDRKKDRYIEKEYQTITGSAREIMRDYESIKYSADLFGHTKWEIVDIQE